MSVSVCDYTQQLLDSKLLSAEKLGLLLASLPAEQRPCTGKQLARLLIKRELLTAFQAQQVYSGKGKLLDLGKYVILDRLGRGGMGLVLKAKHRRMKRTVAVKVLSPKVGMTSKALKRFQREIEATAQLNHPNIVAAYDADKVNGTRFLVMEYVDGSDLNAVVKTEGPLPVARAVSVILQVARGLEYAHAFSMVHRDIKPANLLLSRDGTVKILDMGLARLNIHHGPRHDLTIAGHMLGTVDFMAPEQAIDSKSADARADIYSLGATLWYVLTGRMMYVEDAVAVKLLAHRNAAIPSLQAVLPQVSSTLETIFTRMVAKTPETRYQSMTEVIAALSQYEKDFKNQLSVDQNRQDDSQLITYLNELEHANDPLDRLTPLPSSKGQPSVSLQSAVTTQSDIETQSSFQILAIPVSPQISCPNSSETRVRRTGIFGLLRHLQCWFA